MPQYDDEGNVIPGTAEVVKPRKLQSNHRCESKTDYRGTQCKHSAKPGMRYCGTHLKTIEAWNERVERTSVEISWYGAPVLVFFCDWEYDQINGPRFCFVHVADVHPKSTLKDPPVVEVDPRGFDFNLMCWGTTLRDKYVINVRLPQEDGSNVPD